MIFNGDVMRYLKIIFCLFFCVSILPAYAANIEVGKEAFSLIIKHGISDDLNRNRDLAKAFCESLNGTRCYSVTSVAEAICNAASGSSCYSVTNIGQALCKAGDGSGCYSVSSIGQGFCTMMHGNSCYSASNLIQSICLGLGGSRCFSITKLDEIQINDVSYAWDEFRVPNAAHRIWACRGIQTGKFAPDEKCSYQSKVDSLWPND